MLVKAPLSSLSLVWTRALRYPWHIVGALVALTTSATAMLSVPWSFKQVIDRGFAAGVDSEAVSSSFHLLLGLVGVLSIATAVRFFLVSWVAERVVADIRNEVQDNLLELSPPFFEDNRPAEIASRLTADTTVIEQVVGSMLSIALRNLFTLVGGVGFMFFYSAKLATMLMIGIPL
ncbi:MAG TPA: ABC transporter transmembrane domain-containing protein, partial [Allosphingosinicella sp.]|nr:ABC transporter transmembrane domain-containing protein [Allosphingosinicella sp.]